MSARLADHTKIDPKTVTAIAEINKIQSRSRQKLPRRSGCAVMEVLLKVEE
jgi:hypothetical protein